MSLSLVPLGSMALEALVLLACAGLWGYSIYGARFQSRPVRVQIGLIRLIIMTLAWLIVHEATLVRIQATIEPQKTAILLDNSGSMSLPGGGKGNKTRREQGLELVNNLRKQKLQTSVYSFDSQLNPGIPNQASSSGTDFMASLNQLVQQPTQWSQIVLISDGHDFSTLSGMPMDELKSWLKTHKIPPIHTVFTGSDNNRPDLMIHSIEAPSFTYIRTPLNLEVTLLARNLREKSFQVQLLENEKMIQFQTAIMDEHGFGRVRFEIYPDTVGEHLYQIHVPPLPQEDQIQNNTQRVLIKTGRDKINVLHIAGSVTPDLQGLRSIFENDPFIDFTAFYILRTQEHFQIGVDGRMIPPDEMALVQFPVEEIFDRQLFSFDVVVFQDFDAGNYFRNSYQARKLMEKIKAFVTSQSGGLVVIGGPKTANGPSLALTAVGDILPVELKRHRSRYHEEDPGPLVGVDQSQHPILSEFRELPSIFGYMETDQLNPDAHLLLQTKTKEPILATRYVGKGRTVFLNTSSSWVWRRSAMSAGGTSESYDRFWRQILKWVSGDPSINPSVLSLNNTREQPLKVQAELVLRDKDYRPLQNKSGQIQFTLLEGSKTEEAITVPFTTSKEGRAVVHHDLPTQGFYKVKLDSGDKTNEDTHYMFLGGSVEEFQESAPIPETLKNLADLSGGTYWSSPSDVDYKVLENGQVNQKSQTRLQRTRLRDSLILLPLFLLLAGLEWFIRRQNHLA